MCDILHAGHINFFKECKNKCDFLICGVLDDLSAKEKGKITLMPFHQRFEIITQLKLLNHVIGQFEWSPLNNCKMYKPNILFECYEQKDQPTNRYVRSYGGSIYQIKRAPYISSTELKQEIIRRYEDSHNSKR